MEERDWTGLMSLADEAMESIAHRRIVVHRHDEDGKEYLGYITPILRLHEAYRRRLTHRFENLELRGVGVTLTMRPRATIRDSLRELQAAWNRWLTSMRKRTRLPLHFFRVIEIGSESCMVHIHAIFPCVRYLHHALCRRLWQQATGGDYVVWVTRGSASATEYARKYLLKGLNVDERIEWAWISLCIYWAMGRRQWTASQGLIAAVPHAGGWDLVGVLWEESCTGIYLVERPSPGP